MSYNTLIFNMKPIEIIEEYFDLPKRKMTGGDFYFVCFSETNPPNIIRRFTYYYSVNNFQNKNIEDKCIDVRAETIKEIFDIKYNPIKNIKLEISKKEIKNWVKLIVEIEKEEDSNITFTHIFHNNIYSLFGNLEDLIKDYIGKENFDKKIEIWARCIEC